MVEEENLRQMVASLEERLVRLQYEHNLALETVTTQQDQIHGLKEELERQKCLTSDTQAKLHQQENQNKFLIPETSIYQEKCRSESTIKNLTGQLDVQNRLIATLSDEANKLKTENPNEKLTKQDCSRKLNDIRKELNEFKIYVIAEKNDLRRKLIDVQFICQRLSSTCHNVDPSKYVVLQRQMVKEFCDEIEEVSLEMMNEVKNL